MNGGTLTILADAVTPASSLSVADAERELSAASADVSKRGTPEARRAVEHRQRLAYARVALARGSRR
jgi:F0F1-type ATP synthase epsilon subunit